MKCCAVLRWVDISTTSVLMSDECVRTTGVWLQTESVRVKVDHEKPMVFQKLDMCVIPSNSFFCVQIMPFTPTAGLKFCSLCGSMTHRKDTCSLKGSGDGSGGGSSTFKNILRPEADRSRERLRRCVHEVQKSAHAFRLRCAQYPFKQNSIKFFNGDLDMFAMLYASTVVTLNLLSDLIHVKRRDRVGVYQTHVLRMEDMEYLPTYAGYYQPVIVRPT
eukprot:g43083.t1